jgi:hypothetical protein
MLASARIWLNHFEYHAEHPRSIREDLPNVLSAAERAAIARSIATFQLGEQSPGRTLSALARGYAARHDCEAIARITELLIREESRHAELLGEFMDGQAIPRRRRAATDLVFRLLRRLGGFEHAISVLVAAELIGNVYYRALETATRCERLRVLCRTLVADELAHIGFESELLFTMRELRPALARAIERRSHRAFFLAMAVVVWHTHRPVLRRAGYGLRTFLAACRAQYAFYLEPARAGSALTADRA